MSVLPQLKLRPTSGGMVRPPSGWKVRPPSRRRWRTLVTVVGAAVGLALFAYAVERVGADALIEGVRRVGWGIVAILLLSGARFAVRAQCWRWCLPPDVSLDFPHAFGAFLAGDGLGNVTPLGLLASEPMKILLTRHHLATMDSVASLALENILYGVSVLAMVGGGLTLMLCTVPVPGLVRWGALGVLTAILVAAPIIVIVLRASRWRSERLTWLLREISRFAGECPDRLVRVLALQFLFHAIAIAETFLTLRWLLGDRSPTFVQAVIFETVNRLTTVLFKFVPFRIGVDEAASGALAPLLVVTAAAGVTLAVVRKARVLFWSAIGLLVIAAHPAGNQAVAGNR